LVVLADFHFLKDGLGLNGKSKLDEPRRLKNRAMYIFYVVFELQKVPKRKSISLANFRQPFFGNAQAAQKK
jgi:hypothetical protein